jgi:uncharacterized protein (TIGR02001 family)
MARGFRFGGTLLQAAAVATTLFWAEAAFAKDEALEPEPAPTETPAPSAPAAAPGAKFDFAFGLAGTSDYVSRGITQTDSRPAIQGYVEPSYGIGYVNIWSSNVDFGSGFRGTEIDVAGGLRPKFGDLSLNFGWVHYFYAPESVSPAYGEIFAKADYKVTDKFIVGARVWFAPDFSQTGKTATFPVVGAKYLLTDKLSVYAGIGYQFFEDPHAFEDLAWTAGASYVWKSLTFDVRYWDTNLSSSECVVRSGFSDGCDARVVGTISLDLTWSAFAKAFHGTTASTLK